MAEVLRWTPLRHQMLIKIQAGQVMRTSTFAGTPRICANFGEPDLTGSEKRAAGDLHRHRLVAEGRRVSKSMLSPAVLGLGRAGEELLARWDSEHPEVAGG